jgi:hypothetical protein
MRETEEPSTPHRRSEWYYVDAGDVQGPVSRWALLRLLVAHDVPEDTLVWRAGMDDWTRACLVPEVASLLPPEAPSPPDEGSSRAEAGSVDAGPAPAREEPVFHPHSPSERSGRGVVALFVIAILAVITFAVGQSDGRSSRDAADTVAASRRGETPVLDVEHPVLDGALASFPESKRRTIRGFIERMERLVETHASRLKVDTLGSLEAAEKAGRAWAREGARRLPDDDLSGLLTLERKRMEAVDAGLCGRLLEGTADQEETWRATASLSPPDLDQYLDIRLDAVRAELRSDPPRRPFPADDAVSSALSAIFRVMPRRSADSLRRIFEAESITPEQECRGALTLIRSVDDVSEPHRSVLIRYLLWFDTEPGAT